MKKLVENLKCDISNYLSIYGVAKVIGRNVESLKIPRHRKRFMEFIEALPEGMIQKVELDKRIVLEVGFPSVKILYNLQSVEKFLSENIRKSDTLKLMGGMYGQLLQLEKLYGVPIYELGSRCELKFYPRKIINDICCVYDREKYVTIYEIARTQYKKGLQNSQFIRNLKMRIDKLPNGMISKKELEIKYYDSEIKKLVHEVYLKKDVEKFFSEHILKEVALKKIEEQSHKYTTLNYYKKLKIKSIILGGKYDVFISKSDYEKLKLMCTSVTKKAGYGAAEVYASILGYFTQRKVEEILKLTSNSIKELIKARILVITETFHGIKLFDAEHVKQLHEEQMSLLREYKNKYYTIGDVKEKYGESFSRYIIGSEEKIRIPIDKKEVPTILIGNINYHHRKVYSKSQVDSIWPEYKLYNEMNSSCIGEPYDNFVYKVEQVLKVSFKKHQENTKGLWYQYVKKYLYSTNMADKSRIDFLVNQFARNTEIIFSIFKQEIYTYSASAVNELYFSCKNNIKRSYQRDFYSFLKHIINSFTLNSLPVPFNITDITDPKTYKKIKQADTSIYSLEEYHALYEYSNRVAVHKEKAIQDVNRYIKTMDITKYKHYDSCWLYILVQLTNNWRHGTVLTQIPRIDLSNTKIESLEWLKENDPSLEDANNIIFQIGRYVIKVNKTGVSAEGLFTIGEPLKIAFATAISICEFRAQASMGYSETLIQLVGNLVPKYNPHKEFFKEFNKAFKFENRKINRTLTTLIWSVLRHLGKGLKESQVSRRHLQDETTIDHYIKLNDVQVEHLVLELFERSQFGFVTQLLTNILFGAETNKTVETDRMLAINKHFADVIKIEATAGLINRLAIEKEEVMRYVNKLDFEEIRKLYYQSIAGVLTSKQMYYQCIYSQCQFEDELGEQTRCDTCAASIVNAYALSNIMDNYIYFMETILKEFDYATTGEKQKLANHFYLIHNVVKDARRKFGREAVDGFVEGKTERIRVLGEKLAPKKLKRYRTSGIIKEAN